MAQSYYPETFDCRFSFSLSSSAGLRHFRLTVTPMFSTQIVIVHSQGKLSAYAVEEYDTANHFAPLFFSKSVAECQNTRYDATMSTSLRMLTTGCRTHHLL